MPDFADACGNCVMNVELPTRQHVSDGEILAHYRCTDCGHTWTTSWRGE